MLWSTSIWVIIFVIFLLLTKGIDSVSAAAEASILGDDQEESQVEALSRDLERLAINPDCSLYQLSSSQEETQSNTDDSSSQATCVQYPKPADNSGKSKVAAFQWFMDECSIGPVGSIMKRP